MQIYTFCPSYPPLAKMITAAENIRSTIQQPTIQQKVVSLHAISEQTGAPVFTKHHGVVAHLVEHLVRNQKVVGSSPIYSTEREALVPLFFYFVTRLSRVQNNL